MSIVNQVMAEIACICNHTPVRSILFRRQGDACYPNTMQSVLKSWQMFPDNSQFLYPFKYKV